MKLLSRLTKGDIDKKSLLFVFLLVFVSDDTLLFGTNGNYLYIAIKYGVLLAMFCYFVFQSLKTGFFSRPKGLGVALILTFIILFSGLINGDFGGGYLYKVLLVLIGLFAARTIPISTFLDCLVVIITVISAVSLIAVLVGLIMPDALSFFPVIINTEGFEVRNLFLTCVPFDSTRLFGPFREPGVFQIYLNVALIYVLSKDVLNKFQFIILSGALILTTSTTGYIAYALVLLYFVLNGRRKGSFFIFLIAVVGLSSLYLFTDLLSAEGMVFNKLHDSQRYTTIARLASVTSNFEIAVNNPLFGCGHSKLDILFPMYSANTYGIAAESNTNMLMVQFATYGFVFGFLWSYYTGRFFTLFSKKLLPKMVLIGVFVAICIGENLSWSVFYYILMFYPFFINKKVHKAGSHSI